MRSRRARGLSLIEMIVAITLLGVLVTNVAILMSDGWSGMRLADGYVRDIVGVRGALDAVERDVRDADTVVTAADELTAGSIEWRLTEDGVLERQGLALARNVARFDASREGGLVRIEIAPGGRRAPDSAGPPVVSTVRMRGGGR